VPHQFCEAVTLQLQRVSLGDVALEHLLVRIERPPSARATLGNREADTCKVSRSHVRQHTWRRPPPRLCSCWKRNGSQKRNLDNRFGIRPIRAIGRKKRIPQPNTSDVHLETPAKPECETAFRTTGDRTRVRFVSIGWEEL
jgi:hypothetical protein